MDPRANQAPNGRDALVGRESELGELSAALDDALAERGRVVIVSGEPGVGKTRLVEEAASRALASGARVWWGRCWEGGGAPVSWAWIQVLRAALRPADRT